MMPDDYSSEDLSKIEDILNDLNERILNIRKIIKIHPDLVYHSVHSLVQISKSLLDFLFDDKTLKRELMHGISKKYSEEEVSEIEMYLNEIEGSILFTRRNIKKSSKVLRTAIRQTACKCKLMLKFLPGVEYGNIVRRP